MWSDVAYEIPESLYEKAAKHQAQLTDSERTLLLSRGDLVGRALAQPASLTREERYTVLRMPSPETVRSRIQRATGGVLSEPGELYMPKRARPGRTGTWLV